MWNVLSSREMLHSSLDSYLQGMIDLHEIIIDNFTKILMTY
jgi:hypothetical protein